MSPLFSVLYVIGITAESMTTALSAGRQKLDLFGVTMIASITALGGGTVRDIVLADPPLTWVEHPIYLVIVIAAAIVTVGMSFLMHYFRHLFLILDALGLAVFSVLGTQIAAHLGYGFIIASVSAVISGVFGGVLRDLLSDRIPLVFSGEFYAAISILAAGLYMILLRAGLSEEPTAIITALVCFSARLAAIYFKKGLPVFEYRDGEQQMDPRLRLSARIVRDGARRAKRKAGAATRYASPITRPLIRNKRTASDFSSPLSLEELNSNRIARPTAHASITRPSGKHSPGARGVDVQQQWTFNKEDVGRQRTPKHKQ
ncbi:trimeric intracellular cation channel family protein [Corynebacterium accolens]|uniref:trimeric intracellular cation channel family protein n=1 Tax=Corynebacterium accolens TaxID=38284 RepID=UPI0026702EF1|nr:trimeric intracellular cation channel family protein [Corynebacterium accolens]WKS54803.1 trimeric intracellular cation channel family protein [Corynebacterium accolens]